MRKLQLPAQPETIKRLLAFAEQMQRWNRAYNLTAVRQAREIITRHLLDSLAIAPYVAGTLVDVGSGAGLPAVPLAILDPTRSVIAVDSSGKRCRFLRAVTRDLKLDNLQVVQSRVEAWQPQLPETVTIASRAFARLSQFVEQTAQLGGIDARWLAMKAKLDEQELAEVPEGFRITDTYLLQVPGLQGQRHAVMLQRIVNADDAGHL